MAQILDKLPALEKMASLLAESTSLVPPELRNKGDCFALCVEALAKNESPLSLIAIRAAPKCPKDSASSSEKAALALLDANDKQSFTDAEVLMNTVTSSDEVTNLLALIHGHTLQRINESN